MTINYPVAIKDARLGVVAAALDVADPAPAMLVIGTSALDGMDGALAVFQLPLPACTVSNGQLLLNALPMTTTVIASGEATLAALLDGAGNPVVVGLTVGLLTSGADVLIHNIGLIAGGEVELLEGTITHS